MLISAEKDDHGNGTLAGALIVGDFKIIVGQQIYGFWQGPVYPNVGTRRSTTAESGFST